jgi:hypothetical protein
MKAESFALIAYALHSIDINIMPVWMLWKKLKETGEVLLN